MSLSIGGRYEILGDIATGGFAEVFTVRDTTAGPGAPILALKMPRPDRLADPDAAARFKREISFGVQLPHPNLMPVLDHGEDAGIRWFVMPYADGGNLTDHIPGVGLDPVQVLEILVPIAGAVAFLHDNGTIHRDISSNNVLHRDTEWVLSDMGLSVSSLIPTSYYTTTGISGLGIVGYVAPEQRIGLKTATTRSDIYSLGKLVQHMSEGVWPEHTHRSSGPFAAVITQATHLDPALRCATVQDLVEAVRLVATAPPATGSIADRVDEILATPAASMAAKGPALSALIASLDPHDEYEQEQIGIVLARSTPAAWGAAFSASPDQTLLAIENAAQAIYDEATFTKLDGLMAGLLNADRAVDSPQVRHRVVATLAHVGYSNDQWSYQRGLAEMVTERTPPARQQATLGGFREAGPDATRWALDRVRFEALPNPLRGWLEALIA